MKVLVEGHKYELSNFDNKEEQGQVLQFIQKEPITEGSTELQTIIDGTTNEELIEILLDRMNYLESKFPCRENPVVIRKLEEALLFLNNRTLNRIERNVEGKQIV